MGNNMVPSGRTGQMGYLEPRRLGPRRVIRHKPAIQMTEGPNTDYTDGAEMRDYALRSSKIYSDLLSDVFQRARIDSLYQKLLLTIRKLTVETEEEEADADADEKRQIDRKVNLQSLNVLLGIVVSFMQHVKDTCQILNNQYQGESELTHIRAHYDRQVCILEDYFTRLVSVLVSDIPEKPIKLTYGPVSTYQYP